MKRLIFLSTLMAMLIAGAIYTGCESSTEKVSDAKQDLKEAQREAEVQRQKDANAEAWNAFKAESDEKIKANEAYIADLKVKMKASGKKIDAAYEKGIDDLEQKNKDLKTRVDQYQNKGQNDWATFKTEFNHDMDGLGKAIKDIGVNNKRDQ